MSIQTKINGYVKGIKNIFVGDSSGNARVVRSVFVGDEDGKAKLVFAKRDPQIVFTGNFGNTYDNYITYAAYNPVDKSVVLTGNFTSLNSLSELKYTYGQASATLTGKSLNLGPIASRPKAVSGTRMVISGNLVGNGISLVNLDAKTLDYIYDFPNTTTIYQWNTNVISKYFVGGGFYSEHNTSYPFMSNAIYAGYIAGNDYITVAYKHIVYSEDFTSYTEETRSINLTEYKYNTENANGQTAVDRSVLFLNAVKKSDSLPYMLALEKPFDKSLQLVFSKPIPLEPGVSSTSFLSIGQGQYCNSKSAFISVLSYRANDNVELASFGQLNVRWETYRPGGNGAEEPIISKIAQKRPSESSNVSYTYRRWYLLGIEDSNPAYAYVLDTLGLTFKIIKILINKDDEGQLTKVAEYDTGIEITSTTSVYTPIPRYFSNKSGGQCPAFMTNENGQYKKFVIVPLSMIK